MDTRYDVIIIGGGPAGLSAALVLGRARQRTLLLDAGEGRNATAAAAHGVFTRDGTPPAELRAIGRAQLGPYGVEVRDVAAIDAVVTATGFEVELADGQRIAARRVLLTTGLRDELPPIPGLAERWGGGVATCPFCHGWEVRDRPLAVYNQGPGLVEHAALIRNWSRDLVVCTNGPTEVSDDDRARLAAIEVPIREERIVELLGPAPELTGIVFTGGEVLERAALFVKFKERQRSVLPTDLGCALTEQGRIAVDAVGWTSVPGVWAAGDAAQGSAQVVLAAASGALAAAGLVHDLVAAETPKG